MYRSARVVTSVVLFAGLLSVGTATAGASARSGRDVIDTHRVAGFPEMRESARGLNRTFSLRRATAPVVTSQPVADAVTAGASASFHASASGSPTPSVQWYVSSNAGASFTAVANAKSTTLTFTTTLSENGYEYEAIFSNSAGKATTNAATLTVSAPVNSAPVVTTQPTNQSVSAGATATFSAAASGYPTPSVQWEVEASGASGFTAVAGATSTTYSFVASASQNGSQYEAVFTNSQGSATTNPATLTVGVAPVQSSNWSGYADINTTFSAVTGNWTVPTLTCSGSATTYSSEWIGIDGYSSSTVEQDGTEADCLGGVPSYDAWYEMYGDNAVNNGYEVELSSSYPVAPGDAMSASVSVSGSTWTLTIADSTKGWNFTTTVSDSSVAKSSAEWIVERPEVCNPGCALTSLANFGTATFTNATATSGGVTGGISATAYSVMEMVNGTTVLAVPSGLSANGESFSDVWKAA
jgi:hypothetical protein